MLEELQFEGAAVVVTGAGSGIGQAAALALGELGATLILADISETGLDQTRTQLGQIGAASEAHRVDVTRLDQITAFADAVRAKHGRLKGLVNNAGNSHFTPVPELADEDWHANIELNLTSIYRMCKAFHPLLKASPTGAAIVNVASIFAFMAFPATPVYAAAKGGVVSLSRQMAADFGKDGIRVNAICPGATLSPAVQRDIDAGYATREQLQSRMLLGRIAECREIGNAIAFLASDASSFMTGAPLIIDGGQSLG